MFGTTSAWGPTLAAENAAVEREIEELRGAQQTRAAAGDILAAVPARFRQRRDAAAQAVLAARRALDQADRDVRARIGRERPSEALARLWYEEATQAPSRALEAAEAEFQRAELALGEQVEARRALEQLEADAPARRAEAERIYLQALDQVDKELKAARLRCALE